MKTPILPVLLLSAAFPFAAMAQDTTTPSTAPDATQTQPTTDQMNTTDPATATPAPADNANSATSVAPTDQTASAATGDTFVTVPETGAWRVSDLQGKAVYGSDGANIGEINDVLVSQDGSINAVIIGVGGFLGIGEKDVAVNMSALQLGPGDTEQQAKAAIDATTPDASVDTTGATGAVTDPGVAAAPGTAMTGTDPAAGGTDMAANEAKVIGDDALPDRIILNVTREQLEQAPEFEGVRAQP